jgi:hypothetical protein
MGRCGGRGSDSLSELLPTPSPLLCKLTGHGNSRSSHTVGLLFFAAIEQPDVDAISKIPASHYAKSSGQILGLAELV